MKAFYLFLLPFLLILSFLGCNSDDDTQLPLDANTFIAQKNNDPSEGTAEIQLMENDYLTFWR